MPTSEQLLRDFIADHRAGDDPDPRDYLHRVPESDRVELAALIDHYLANRPRRGWDERGFRASPARAVVEGLERSLEAGVGTWSSLLPQLRNALQLRRAELVSRLAVALGVPHREDKVRRYYHEMEQGLLPPEGVSAQVLVALAGILRTDANALQQAGRALRPRADGDVAFARTAIPDEAYPDEVRLASSPLSGDEWDEVDRLFRGGED